jgi:UDP-N-acetylglucosamine diphosphorylase/glucosamine-1-phosphate N-acetyltransferase
MQKFEVSKKELIVVILAGGLGKRMNSDLPKVLHHIGNEPMIVKVIKEAKKLKPSKIMIVVGYYQEIIRKTIANYVSTSMIEFIYQEKPMGTGHALQCCRQVLLQHTYSRVLVLSGDVPLITAKTMRELLEPERQGCSIMTTHFQDPTGYGRIVINEDGFFQEIIEEKDCTEEQRAITEVNCGIYLFDCIQLCKYLPKLENNNSQGEYYLTDIIRLIRDHEQSRVERLSIPPEKQIEIMGVNTPEQLAQLADMACFASILRS